MGVLRGIRGYLNRLWDQVESVLFGSAPPNSQAQATAADRAPAVWLLGKTGAGKTSIVAALTGDDRATVGNGFQPATKTAFFYDVPPEAPLLRFLDTRGVGEAGYDPAEDIAWCESSAHALLCVARVSDPVQTQVVSAARAARRKNPGWPVIVAQTGLHEFYPRASDHPSPYPYSGGAEDLRHRTVPASLAAALGAQRELFSDLGAAPPPRFVPVDLTKAEDGFSPSDFGADALVEALAGAGVTVVTDLRHAAEMDALRRKARLLILGYAAAAGVAGAAPLPGVALPGMASVQAGMLNALAGRYGLVLTPALFRDLVGAVGGGTAMYWLLIRFGAAELLKLVPGVGTVPGALMNSVGSFALTYALGEAACVYFGYTKKGQTPPNEEVRRAFRQAFAEGLKKARQQMRRGPKA